MAARGGGPALRPTPVGRVRRTGDRGLTDPLDLATLERAVEVLAARDPVLADIAARLGPPPLWDRPPGFGTLVHIVLEQQVSLASALAAYRRLETASGTVTPERFLAFSDGELLAIGISRQKARYGRAIANALIDGALDLDRLVDLDDDAVRLTLEAIPGIGRWTSTIYLLMVLGRPDVWPVGDMALATAIAEATGRVSRPDPVEMEQLGELWRPWRSVAARLFWHDYLARRRTTI